MLSDDARSDLSGRVLAAMAHVLDSPLIVHSETVDQELLRWFYASRRFMQYLNPAATAMTDAVVPEVSRFEATHALNVHKESQS